MEATDEQSGVLHLHNIVPPRLEDAGLEDAGLEDCALPPDSIHEAFLKAASAVKSRAASIFTSADDPSDVVVGAETGIGCGGEKGGAVEVGGDAVVVGGEEEKKDKVIVGSEDVREADEGKACADGLIGLDIDQDEKKKKKKKKNDDESPILVGGYA